MLAYKYRVYSQNMPKNANGSKRCAAEKKNKGALEEALSGPNPIIGRVEKALGNSGFQVTIKNPNNNGPKTVQGLIRGVFKGGRQSAAFCSPGVFVILSPSEGTSEVHEISGVINRKKDLKALKDANLIPECLKDEECDDFFELEEEFEEEEEVKPDLSKKESARVTAGREVNNDIGLDEL
jgi:hypothetical protein